MQQSICSRRLIRLHGGQEPLKQRQFVGREGVQSGVLERAQDELGWRLIAQDRESPGGELGVLFGAMSFRYHQDIIRPIICPQDGRCDVYVFNGIEDPSVEDAKGGANNQREKQSKETGGH